MVPEESPAATCWVLKAKKAGKPQSFTENAGNAEKSGNRVMLPGKMLPDLRALDTGSGPHALLPCSAGLGGRRAAQRE